MIIELWCVNFMRFFVSISCMSNTFDVICAFSKRPKQAKYIIIFTGFVAITALERSCHI